MGERPRKPSGKVCILDVISGTYADYGGFHYIELQDCEPESVGVFSPGAVRCYDRVTVEIPVEAIYEAIERRINSERKSIGASKQAMRRCWRELEDEPKEQRHGDSRRRPAQGRPPGRSHG